LGFYLRGFNGRPTSWEEILTKFQALILTDLKEIPGENTFEGEKEGE
jgi:hypothetical protein